MDPDATQAAYGDYESAERATDDLAVLEGRRYAVVECFGRDEEDRSAFLVMEECSADAYVLLNDAEIQYVTGPVLY